MFQSLSKFLRRKQENIEQKQALDLNSVIKFRDLTLQNINISLEVSGNETYLQMNEPKNNFSINIDKETALVLSVIFKDYGTTGKLNRVSALFEKEIID